SELYFLKKFLTTVILASSETMSVFKVPEAGGSAANATLGFLPKEIRESFWDEAVKSRDRLKTKTNGVKRVNTVSRKTFLISNLDWQIFTLLSSFGS
ncbi:MAG: hypothetical protein KGJ07_06420, partial [Patescibacteria group bacterium]|nr:hypothetical protein [Patescibacteria group bacterium]